MAFIDFNKRYLDKDGAVAVLQAEEGASIIDELRYAVRIANGIQYCRSEIIINGVAMVVHPDDNYEKLLKDFRKKLREKKDKEED